VHVCGEEALFDFDAAACNQLGDFFVELVCEVWFGGSFEAWSATLAAISVKRKIAHEQYRPADVGDTAIHLAGLIGEDTKADELFGHEVCVFGGVGVSDAEIDEQSVADFPDDICGNLDFGP